MIFKLKESKTTLLFIITICGILCYSCKKTTVSSKSNACDTLRISLNIENQTDISDIIQDVKYLPLETHEQCILRDIRRIEFFEGRYYILDTDRLLCFDESGNFLHQIGTKGKGPQEYPSCNDFFLDRTNRYIYILSYRGGRYITRYNTDNEFKGKTLCPITYSGMVVSEDKHIFYLGNKSSSINDYFLMILDENFRNPEFTFPYEKNAKLRWGNYVNLYLQDDSTMFYPPLSNTLYKGNTENLYPRYHFDFGKHVMPDEVKSKILKMPAEKQSTTLKSSQYVVSIDHFLETKDWLFFKFKTGQSNSYQVYYSKTNRKTYHAENGFIGSGGQGLLGHPVGIKEESFITPLSMSFLHGTNQWQKDYQKCCVENNERLNEIKKNSKLYDNPILVIAHPK